MNNQNVILLEYSGFEASFTRDGWFNATTAAEKFGKRVADWLENQETKDYVQTLALVLKVPKERDLIRAKRGRYGGTWLHPKLAVAFARWLDTRFAVWCDLQIDCLIRGDHPDYDRLKARDAAAASHKVMAELLRLTRLDEGKETQAYHYSNENRLVNWAFCGEFRGVDREALKPDELAFLAALEERNAVLLARGLSYEARKTALRQFADTWQTARPLAIRRAA
jgi:hypothetical protein